MKVGGQIPWNVTPICETFKISCLMGRLHTKDVVENFFKGPIIPFGSLRKTSQESINLESKSDLDCSSDMHFTRVEFGRVTYWMQTLRSWRRWTNRNLLEKTQCERGDISQRKTENLPLSPQMDESIFLEEIRTWEHPPWHGITQFEEKVESIFLENQKGLFHHLTTRFWMPVKR